MIVQKSSVLAALAVAGAVLVTGLASGGMAQTAPENGERGSRMVEMFAELDADSDGKVTQEELTAHRAARFAAADTNGDGTLSPEELSARELARFTESLPDRTARFLDRQDDNGDGSLSADEIREGPLEERFARIDADNDGAISQAEVEAAAKHLAERRGKHKDGWFN